MNLRAIITDLDNTLYDWVTFFALAFDAMVSQLTGIVEIDREILLSEFKTIHQRYGSTETPWAALELPSVRRKFPYASSSELAERLDPAFKAFSAARKRYLALYEGVADTLEYLVRHGIIVVGHTEALPVNAFYRLTLLGVADRFSRLYAVRGKIIEHPFPERLRSFPSPELIRTLPESERKPNPAVLLDICRQEGFSPQECLYVGDSRTRDVAMAKQAGVAAVWARYGTRYDVDLWKLLVAVTHWTPADVEREIQLKQEFGDLQPDYTIDSFDQLLSLPRLQTVQQFGASR